jgi:hypothetical protein
VRVLDRAPAASTGDGAMGACVMMPEACPQCGTLWDRGAHTCWNCRYDKAAAVVSADDQQTAPRKRRAKPDPAPARDGTRADPLPNEPRTELGYARRLIAVYGDRLRYVPAWRCWLIWDGTRWARDGTGQAPRWMKSIAAG